MKDGPVILVIRPHQRPGQAYAYSNREALIDAWLNGAFANYHASSIDYCSDPANGIEAFNGGQLRDITIDDAMNDISHDVHGADLIESWDEALAYMAKPGHNKPHVAIVNAAESLGWIGGDE